MRIEELNNLTLIWGPLSEQGLCYLQQEASASNLRVAVPENRPAMVGLRHNITLLKKAGIASVYCTDNMLGFLFFKQKISQTLLFCKSITDKQVITGCGGLFAVYLSKLHGIPIKVFAQGEFNVEHSDRDASSLGGKSFVLAGNEAFIQQPQDEIIDRELI